MIAPETIEHVAAANDIVEVIGTYFPLKRAGGNYRALCPFHQEKTPSFNVSSQRQSFHCFGCGVGGSVFRFVMMYENMEFPAAVRKLAERAGIPILEDDMGGGDPGQKMRRRLLALHHDATEWFHQSLLTSDRAAPARVYLKSRGVNSAIARAWKLGYAPDAWEAFATWGRERGYLREELVASGLVKQRDLENKSSDFYDRFRDRVMFPIANAAGEVIAFSGRQIAGEPAGAKYINSPETLLFTKGSVLFGLHKARRALLDKNAAIVCEGQLDLITVFEAGVEHVVAPQGTAFTSKQAQILKRYVEEVILCFDADPAGQKAAAGSLPALLDTGLVVRVAEMPPGCDPDSLVRTQGVEAFRAAIDGAKDFFDFQIERQTAKPEFATVKGKMQFAREMATWVALISEPVFKQAVINRITARLEMSPRDFERLLPRPPRGRGGTPGAGQVERVKQSPTYILLCTLALRDVAARTWLLEQPWRAVLNDNDEGKLLHCLLGADINPQDPHSLSAFMSTLEADEEAALSAMLLDKLPQDAERVAWDCWRALERAQLERRREALASRLRLPDLAPDEATEIQKQILDVQGHLTDITRPLAPPPL